MALIDVDATVKTPAWEIKLDGLTVRDILSVGVQQTLGAVNEATVQFLNSNAFDPENPIIVSLGYDNQVKRVFTGIVDDVLDTEYPATVTVKAKDMLKRAQDCYFTEDVKFGIDVVQQLYYYTTLDSNSIPKVHSYSSLAALNAAHPETTGNITSEGALAEAVVQWLLVMSGLNEGTQIQVDSTDFFIGDVKPLSFVMTSAYDAINQICELIGWYIFCDQSGVVRFKVRPRNQSSVTTLWSYTSLDEPYNIRSFEIDKSSNDLRNYIDVRGNLGIRYIARDDASIAAYRIRAACVSSELIDTQDIAEYMGDRMLLDLNRFKRQATFRADGNPYLFPGNTTSHEHDKFEGRILLEGVSHTLNGGDNPDYSVEGQGYYFYNGDVDQGQDVEVVATIAFSSIVSIGDPTYLVKFDGSGSYSTAGPIVDWNWTFPGAVTTSGSTVWYAFQDSVLTSGVNISLSVTDSLGNIGSITVSGVNTSMVVSGAGDIKYRMLYGALTSIAVASSNGGASWNTASIGAISVAASNFGAYQEIRNDGFALFGTSDSKVYKTEDCLVTAPSVVLNATGKVLHVDVAELDSRYCLAATDTGTVYRSIDEGDTWDNLGVSSLYWGSVPVYQARHAYQDYSYILVLASGINNMWESFDEGSTFTRVFTGAGQHFLWNDAGTATNYYGHTRGVGFWSNGAFVEINFAGISPGSGASQPAISVMIDNDAGLMTVGQNITALWRNETATIGNTLQLGSTYPGIKVRHFRRDGEIPNLNYYATTSGIDKSLDRNKTLKQFYYPGGTIPTSPAHTQALGLGSTGYGEMVAYGPLRALTTVVAGGYLVPATKTVSGTTYQIILKYQEGVWTEHGQGQLPTTAQSDSIQWIDVNPANPNIWLVLLFGPASFSNHTNTAGAGNNGHIQLKSNGISPLWITTDNGQTFSQVTLNTNCDFIRPLIGPCVRWSVDGTVAMLYGDGSSPSGDTMWWWISPTGIAGSMQAQAGSFNTGCAVTPVGNSFVVIPAPAGGKMGYLLNNGTAITLGATTTAAASVPAFGSNVTKIYHGGWEISGNFVSDTTMVSVADYTSGSTSTFKTGIRGFAIHPEQDTAYIVATDIIGKDLSTGTEGVVHTASNLGFIFIDNQTHSLLAARSLGAIEISSDGTTWSTITLPTGVTAYDRVFPVQFSSIF